MEFFIKRFLFLTLLFSFLYIPVFSSSICLNMIVKNESEAIEKCLGSVKKFIDYWVIVDTGSTDGTQEIIRKFMKDIPGELHERPWVNFAENRNQALELAKNKGDYLLFIDADEALVCDEKFAFPDLDKDKYYMIMKQNEEDKQIDAADVKRVGLVKNALDWRWEGVLHEHIECNEAKSSGMLSGIVNLCNASMGARAKDPLTRKKDGEILAAALEKEPNNSRYAYYAGMSFLAAQEYGLAQEYFLKRIGMPSSDLEETYQALYHLGIAQEHAGLIEDSIQTYFNAHAFRSIRAEPLLRAAILYRKKGNVLLGYLLTQFCLSIPCPTQELSFEQVTYDYKILIEYMNCSLLLGKYREGYKACGQLLDNPRFPADLRARVVANQEVARMHI